MAKDGRGWHGESKRHADAARGRKTGSLHVPRKALQRWFHKYTESGVSHLDASLQPPESRVNSNLRKAKKSLEFFIEGRGMDDHRILRAIEQIEWALKAENFDYIEHALQAKKELSAPTEQQTFEVKWSEGKPSYIVAPGAADARKFALAHLSNLGLDPVRWKILDIRVASDKLAGRGELRRR